MSLRSKAIEAAFRQFVPSYIKAGFSANQALRHFRSIDAVKLALPSGIGRSTGLVIFRNVSHKKIKEDYWRKQSMFDDANETAIVSSDLKGNSRFRYSFHAVLVDGSGNFVEDRFVTVYDNQLRKPSEVLADYAVDANKKGSDITIDWDKSELLELTRNKNAI